MARVIYEVYAKVVDSNGTYSTLSSDTFDSRSFGGDAQKTYTRAEGKFHETIGAMCKAETRQVQSVILMDASGNVIKSWSIGEIANIEETEG